MDLVFLVMGAALWGLGVLLALGLDRLAAAREQRP